MNDMKSVTLAYKNAPSFSKIVEIHGRLYPKILDAVYNYPKFADYVVSALSSKRSTNQNFLNLKLKDQDFKKRIIEKIHKLSLSIESTYISKKLKRLISFLDPKPYFIITTLKRCGVETKQNDDKLWLLYQNYVADIIHNLCASCYPLVTSIAKKAPKDYNFEDKLENGRYGLLVAAYKFDFNKQVKFSTYASYWIRVFIDDYGLREKYTLTINESHLIKATFKNVDADLKQNLKNALAINLSSMGNDEEDYEPDRKIPALQTNISFEDVIAHKKWIDKGEQLMREALTPLEFKIICNRFELFDNDKMTWSTLADIHKVSTYIISKFYNSALEKIKNNRILMDILTDIV